MGRHVARARGGSQLFARLGRLYKDFGAQTGGPELQKNNINCVKNRDPFLDPPSELAGKGYDQISTPKWNPFWRSELVPGQSRRGLRHDNAENAEITIFVIYYGFGGLPNNIDFP